MLASHSFSDGYIAPVTLNISLEGSLLGWCLALVPMLIVAAVLSGSSDIL